MTVRHPEFCWIEGRRYRVGDVVLDLRGGAAPRVYVQPAEGPLSWFVVQTNPNCEDRAEGGLREAGFEIYLPKMSRWQKIAKPVPRGPQKHEVRYPLFPGYLFLGAAEAAQAAWLTVARCDGVRRVLGADGLAEAIRQQALHSVRMLEADCERHFRARSAIASFDRGDMAVVTDGPFTQFTATFIAMSGEDRAKVLLNMLGRMTEVQIPLSALTKVA